MNYAIYLPNFGPFGDARALADLARDAETSGWDGFFIWDHISNVQIPTVDPWVGLTAAALNTSRILIGTTVTPLPRRRPWKLARETVSLDRLSNGRLVLGVGTGGGEKEWGDLGEERDPKTRGAMLDEGLAVLAGLWSGEPFSFSGKYFQVKDQCFQPVPLQQPRIPLWVGGFWPNPAPFRRAARWDGVFPLFGKIESFEDELQQLSAVVDFCRSRRVTDRPFDVVVTGITSGDNHSQAAAEVAHYADCGSTWWLEGIAPYRYGGGFNQPWQVDALRERVLQGPPSA